MDTVKRAWAAVSNQARRFGADREAIEAIITSTLAATVAWLIAKELLDSSHATFAPFSTLLIMQTDASKSVTKALRYTAAVVIGLVLVALVVTPWHAEPLVFAGMLVLALTVGRWRPLGAQGIEVAVSAIFAYSTFVASPDASALAQLPDIASMVVLGTALGVVIDLIIGRLRASTQPSEP
jgi:uncharacterized membrane protein YgaE (UPF0421/DUF939 family)